MAVTGPILIFLANGVQGRAVVRAAQRRGLAVRALVRDDARASALRMAGIDLAFGDLDHPESLVEASRGVAHAVLQVPTASEITMIRQAETAIAAARRSGVRSIILKLASASRPAPCGEPSFRANAAVERIVRGARIPVAVVRPTFYLDNLLKPSARADIVERGMVMLPLPDAQPIAWTCADDCAEAALRLLERGAYGGDHRIAGAESVTGAVLAARLSRGLDRPIRYRAQTVAAFESEVDAAMGPGLGARVASKFRYFAAEPSEAERILAAPFRASGPLVDFVPTPITDWARRHSDRFRDGG